MVENIIIDTRERISEARAAEYIREREEAAEEERIIPREEILQIIEEERENLINNFYYKYTEENLFNNLLLFGNITNEKGEKKRKIIYIEEEREFLLFLDKYLDFKLAYEGKRLFLYLFKREIIDCLEIRQMTWKGERRKKNIEKKKESFIEELQNYDKWIKNFTSVYSFDLFDID